VAYKELNGFGITPDKSKLVIDCVRAEGVIGTHLVQYQSEIDEITLSHKAFNRQGFAEGALLAANWIFGKKGFFTMQDMLHLNLR
ncbi:MAG TPA: dihydrodipicolinate reductase C-terminal domain-containing protein, partial [Bacteroidia bacterium]|nr:dihydrodipicolinate reductase C-terminal domain-containing protein [Bacteroidia bacterium]